MVYFHEPELLQKKKTITIINMLPFQHKLKHDMVKKNLKLLQVVIPIILIQLVAYQECPNITYQTFMDIIDMIA